jgi:hypothetical protein
VANVIRNEESQAEDEWPLDFQALEPIEEEKKEDDDGPETRQLKDVTKYVNTKKDLIYALRVKGGSSSYSSHPLSYFRSTLPTVKKVLHAGVHQADSVW